MKYLKSYNIFESSKENLVDEMVDSLMDILDEHDIQYESRSFDDGEDIPTCWIYSHKFTNGIAVEKTGIIIYNVKERIQELLSDIRKIQPVIENRIGKKIEIRNDYYNGTEPYSDIVINIERK